MNNQAVEQMIEDVIAEIPHAEILRTYDQLRIRVNTLANLSFSQALVALKQGKQIGRKGWNGNGMFVVMSPGFSNLPCEKFFSPHLENYAKNIGGSMNIRPSLMLKTAQDDVAYWVPSCSDLLADDWNILI